MRILDETSAPTLLAILRNLPTLRSLQTYVIWCVSFWLFYIFFDFLLPAIPTLVRSVRGSIDDPSVALEELWGPKFVWSLVTAFPGALIGGTVAPAGTRSQSHTIRISALAAGLITVTGLIISTIGGALDPENEVTPFTIFFFSGMYAVLIAPVVFFWSWLAGICALWVARRTHARPAWPTAISIALVVSYVASYGYFRKSGDIVPDRRSYMLREGPSHSTGTEVLPRTDSIVLYWLYWLPVRYESMIIEVPPLETGRQG